MRTRIHNIIIFFACLVGVVVSCSKDELYDNTVATPGKEVIFSAALHGNVATKTLYGADNPTAIKVKWVDGDDVAVYGVDCSNKQAVYDVSASASSTPNSDDGQNYADKLTKTGEVGIQWGNTGVSDFCAIYPATNAGFTVSGEAIVASTSISATQNYVFGGAPVSKTSGTETITVWEGTHFGSDATNPSMENAIMFARTDDATSIYYQTDEDGNYVKDAEGNLVPMYDENGNTISKPVDLHFIPYTTVLKIRFAGFDYAFEDVDKTKISIQSVTVTAPTGVNIAGDFDLEITGSGKNAKAVAKGTTNLTNKITVNTILAGGSYLSIEEDQGVEFNVFTLPFDYNMGGTDGTNLWRVTITIAGMDPITYKMVPIEVDGATPTYELTAGEIHKIKIPQYTVAKAPSWDYTKWMTQIPTPVYLSELSIPGAWYCMDSGYQNTTDIATLYNAGIRAFNIDCRITRKDGRYSFLGDTEWKDDFYATSDYNFVCAGTDKVGGINNVYVSISGSQLVSDVVKSICSIAQQHLDEYVVIIFTFAEKPSTMTTAATDLYGSVRADYITEQLNAVLTSEGIADYVYTNVTKNTTIEDVIKSKKNVIVKINHPNVDFSTSTTPSFSMPTGHMASFASMAMDGYIQTGVTDIISGLTTNTSPYYGYYAKMQTYPIYIGKTKTDLTYYSHQAQKTSSDQTRGNTTFSATPTLGQRMDAIDDIIKKSVEIYDASSHNAWFQLGIGGSIDGNNQAGVSNVLNEYVRGVIEEKIATDPSPVGLVLMNHATDASGNPIQLVKDIIEMNGKFYLKRAGGDVITGDGDGSDSTNPQAVPTSNGAYAVVGEDAF